MAALRALSLHLVTRSTSRGERAPLLEELTHNLRALGHALEQRQGESWPSLLLQAQVELRRTLDDPYTHLDAGDWVYFKALAILLQLRHAPANAQLAQPGLGLNLIMLALGLEHLLVLSSDPRAPGGPDLSVPARSPREQVLLTVASQLAVLFYRSTLPSGRQGTATELRETAVTLREGMCHPAWVQGASATLVVSRSNLRVFRDWEPGGEEGQEVYDDGWLGAGLLRSLVTPDHPQLLLEHDGALAAILEGVAYQRMLGFPGSAARRLNSWRDQLDRRTLASSFGETDVCS